MSEFNITVEGGKSVKLPTGGKYCDRDIVITATGGGSSDLPSGYRRVDCIQFTGEQIVDTGIILNQDTEIKLLFTREKSSQHYLYGVSSSNNVASVTAYLGGSWRFGNKSVTKNPLTNADMIYSANVNKANINITGSSSAISGLADFETIGTLLIGTCRSSEGEVGSAQYEGKIFFFAIFQGNEQVLKLIPVTDGNTYRFFDMVSQTFFDSITDTPLDGGNLYGVQYDEAVDPSNTNRVYTEITEQDYQNVLAEMGVDLNG